MGTVSTRQRLLVNAERLMAENGIAATSVREITDASDANVASVNYYFGSKNELLLELLKDRFMQLDADLFARLEAAEKDAGDAKLSVEALTFAYFDALVSLGFDPASGKPSPFIMLIQRASSEQESILVNAQNYDAPGIARLMELLSASKPGVRLSPRRASVLAGLMFTSSVDAIEVMQEGDGGPVLVNAIRAFLIAGVAAYLSSLSEHPD